MDLTKKDNSRFVLFPIKHQDLWEMYKEAEHSFWTSEELDLYQDLLDWEKLTEGETHFIKYVLAFFAASDGIVGENLAMRFYNDVGIPEARAFYAFQLMIEAIHSEVYSLLIDSYVRDEEEKTFLLSAIDTIPIVKKKADWAIKWIDSQASFETRLIAFAAVEGIFFSSSFCSIYWLKNRSLMPGLSFSNELISRDEGAHTEFACALYSKSDNRLPKEEVEQIIKEAVDLEIEFSTESIPVELIGMNSKLMESYVKFVADRLLISLGYEKIYGALNPFDFMEKISLVAKSNFFEKRIAEYKKSAVVNKSISFSAEF
jgi:ribonucleotide reductase beta subunit family protein with ferritin-like domain